MRAWAALRPSSVESRFDAFHASGVTELVGREEELEILLRRWSKAKAGEGKVVLLSGEPGIGKSRLTAALLERLSTEPHTRLRYFCSPQHTDSAFYPIISQMERAAGFMHNDTAEGKLDKLDALLAQTSTPRHDGGLFGELLSLPNDGRYPAVELAPQQKRQKTLEALSAQLAALSYSNPVLMVFEDVHWIDPTSLETLGRTVERVTANRVLLVITYRPEFEPPWIGRPHVTALTLNRLGQREIANLIDHLTGNKPLPKTIRQDIIERTDGIPLFVEEMTKAVLEAKSEDDALQTAATIPSSALAVPASLHASLMARLDRLGPAKEVAQTGAVIGREFSHALLAAMVRKPEAELQSALDRLVAAGLLFRQGIPSHASYLFKHALVQDAAYGTLLRDARRALHSRIAETLESQFRETAESQPELLARHYSEAGQIERAALLWGKAGQRSLARSALVEAVEQLTRALDQIATLPATPALRREQIKLQVALVNALMLVKGYAAPEPKAAIEQARSFIERAEVLGEAPEDPLLLFSVLYGFWAASFVMFKGDASCDLAAQFLTLAEKQRASVPLMVGHRLMGTSLVYAGDVAGGRTHLDHAIKLYDPAEHRAFTTRFGPELRVTILSQRSIALWLLGYPEAALADLEQTLSYARESGQAATLIYGLSVALLTPIHCRQYAAARLLVDEVVALADEKGTLFWKAFGMMNQGCILALTGKASDAVQTLTSATTAYQSTGATLFMPWYLSDLAMSYAELAQFDEARRCISEAMTAIETSEERWYEAEFNRIAGEIVLRAPEPDTAKARSLF